MLSYRKSTYTHEPEWKNSLLDAIKNEPPHDTKRETDKTTTWSTLANWCLKLIDIWACGLNKTMPANRTKNMTWWKTHRNYDFKFTGTKKSETWDHIEILLKEAMRQFKRIENQDLRMRQLKISKETPNPKMWTSG